MEFNFNLHNITRATSYVIETDLETLEKRFLDFSVDYRLPNYFPNITIRLLHIGFDGQDIDSIRGVVTVDIVSPTLQNNLEQLSIDILRGLETETELINNTLKCNRLFGYIPINSRVKFQDNVCWCIYLDTPDQKIEYTPLKFCAPTLDVIYNALKKYYYEGE